MLSRPPVYVPVFASLQSEETLLIRETPEPRLGCVYERVESLGCKGSPHGRGFLFLPFSVGAGMHSVCRHCSLDLSCRIDQNKTVPAPVPQDVKNTDHGAVYEKPGGGYLGRSLGGWKMG